MQCKYIAARLIFPHSKGNDIREGKGGSINPTASLRRLQSTRLDTCEEDVELEETRGPERRRKQLPVGDTNSAATTTFCAPNDKYRVFESRKGEVACISIPRYCFA